MDVAPALTSLLAVALLLTGCTAEPDGGAGGTSYDPDRSVEVAGDPAATIEDIVGAGRATRLASTATGEVLVSYLVTSDDDEGPQASAWRLYDDQGDRVAQGRGVRVSEQGASPDVWSTTAGVLLRPDWTRPRFELVRTDGTVAPVVNSRAPTPTRPGDVAIDQLRFFRPADATTYRYAERRPDDRRALDIAVDDRGGVWALVDWRATTIDVLHSADGSAPWTTTSFGLPAGDAYPDRVRVVGDRVVVPVLGGRTGNRTVALRHRPFRDTTGPWASADLGAIDDPDFFGASVEALPDGRLLLGDQRPWVCDLPRGGAGCLELRLPRDAVLIGAVEDLLLAATPDGTGVVVSRDGGATWRPWSR